MYIYIATSPSGKHYIGQTRRSIEVRWREHEDDALNPDKNRCKALNHAIRKYSAQAFNVRVLATCLPWLLDDYEQEFILQFNTVVPHGYNIKLGGSSGQHNEATKSAIRSKLVGKRFSRDTLERRGNSKKQEKRLPMYMCGWYKDGRLIGIRTTYPGLKEKRFTCSRHGGLEQCIQVAEEYSRTGMQSNDQMAVGEPSRLA